MSLAHHYSIEKMNFFKQEHNQNINITELTTGSRQDITWSCTHGHIFNKLVKDFSKPTGTSCPQCRLLGMHQPLNSSKNRKITLGLLINHPLSKEISIRNNVNVNSITLGNNRVKILWTCQLCHNDYPSTTQSRHTKNTGCPICKNKKTQSKNEIRIFSELYSLFNEVHDNYIVGGYKYDIYIKDINLLIEYDGAKWHNNDISIKNDIKKNKIAEKKGFNILRIREKGLHQLSNHDIILDFNTNSVRGESAQNNILILLINYIETHFNIDFTEYKNKSLFNNKFNNNALYNEKISKGFVTNNLTKHPMFAEYDHHKTGIHPKAISCGSKHKVWWKCVAGQDHSWAETPLNRKVTGCPFCANKQVSKTNRVDLSFPKITGLWSIKNDILPSKVTYRNSTNNIIFDCQYCKKEFTKTVANMVDTKGYCPHCRHYNLR